MSKIVSCLCITYKRTSFLEKSIEYFKSQNYSEKELIVVFQDNDDETNKFISENDYKKYEYDHLKSNAKKISYCKNDIIFIRVSKDLTLGEKRNLSIDFSNGEYVCIWDDDDFHHPERITKQLNFLQYCKKSSCVLSNIMIYNEPLNKLYYGPLRPDGWEGTLICLKNKIGRYLHLNKKEDTPVVQELYKSKELSVIECPELYIYFLHSHNTSAGDHFNEMIYYSLECDFNEYTSYEFN
jgi:glycosyltransferase involved in cell wall biosynthesis